MSGVCAFFGHRDIFITPEIEHRLEQAVRGLIALGVDEFWVCNEGNFDWASRMVMHRLKDEFKYSINVCFVSAYNPDKFSDIRLKGLQEKYEIIYTDEIAAGPQKFAITRRNNHIADNADYIICYITTNSGGAYKAVNRAQKYGKRIINIAK